MVSVDGDGNGFFWGWRDADRYGSAFFRDREMQNVPTECLPCYYILVIEAFVKAWHSWLGSMVLMVVTAAMGC